MSLNYTAIRSKLVCCIIIALYSTEINAQTTRRQPNNPVPNNQTSVSIAVLPFRNSLARSSSGIDDVAVLGDGIADSLTNGLKSVAGLAVIDTDLVLKAAEKFPSVEITAKDEDALRIADTISAQIIIAGSFQLIKDRLHIDARILTVHTTKPVPAQIVTADSNYPDGYSTLLNQLATSIIIKLKIPLSKIATEGINSAIGNTHSRQANHWYIRGIQQMRIGTLEALSQAIEFFNKALEMDANYSLAYAAKSEAETQLFEMKKAKGENSGALGKAALNDALGAIKASPGMGRGHRALARAQTALGDYDSAAKSAEHATKAWPSDAGSYLDLAKALGRGELLRNKDIDRALLLQPSLALLLPQLPKVFIKNESGYVLTLRFIPDHGQQYPQVQVNPNSSRIVALFPGQFEILIESAIGKLKNSYLFEAGEDYELKYSAKSFPVAKLTFRNAGNYLLQIRMSGPINKSLAVRPQDSISMDVSPGTYLITARIPGASKSDRLELSEGQEEILEYNYRISRIPVFDPAELIIENDGNASLTAILGGTKHYRLSVPPGGKTFTLPAGTYAIRVSCGSQVSDAGEYELKPNYETTVTGYSCYIRRVIR